LKDLKAFLEVCWTSAGVRRVEVARVGDYDWASLFAEGKEADA